MNFHQGVYHLVRQIPLGRVATYGQIAALLSTPRAARMVGSALRLIKDPLGIPWHRVISSKGYISIQNLHYPAEEQANRLMAEGVQVSLIDGLFVVDLNRYLWQPSTVEPVRDAAPQRFDTAEGL